MEDTNFQEQLLQAPPNAPTAQDADAAKVAQQAQISSALSTNTDPNRPAQSGFETPAAVIPPAPGSFGDKLNRSLLDAFSHPAAKVPGNAGLTLLSAVASAHSMPQSNAWTAAQSNADASQPTTAPLTAPKKGLFSNVFNALRDAQAMNTNPNAIPDRKRQEMTDQITMAHANSQMLHEQALTHKMGEDAIAASAVTGEQGYKAIRDAHIPGTPLAQDKTSDEIKHMIDTKQINPSEDTVFLTGRALTGKDTNGQPLFRSTYSVIKPGGPVDLTDHEDEVKFIKDNTGTNLKGENGKITQIPAVQFNQLWQQASNAAINKRAFQVKEAKDQKVIDEAQNSAAAKQLVKSPTLTNVLSGHTAVSKDGGEDPFARVKTYDYIMNNPSVRAQIEKETGAANFADAYIEANGGKEVFNKRVEEYAKAQAKNQDTVDGMLTKAETDPKEIESHTPAFKAAMESLIASDASPDKKKRAAAILSVVQDVRQGEIDLEKAKAEGKKEASEGFKGNPDATSPEDFLNSLKPEEQSLVKMISSGRAPMIRLEYLAARKPEILEAVERAYPGQFDASKVKSYADTYKDFTSGKTSIALNSGGTALLHLSELQGLNTPASHIPHSPSWTAYQNKADTVASELAKFYGDATVPAIAAIKETLTSTLPGNRNAAITTQAKSMGDKMDSYETQWTNAAPSKTYQAPLPHISNQAKQARAKLDPKYAQEHPEFAPAEQKAPAGSPQKFAVGQSFIQNGHTYKVTSVDANGKVTGAE